MKKRVEESFRCKSLTRLCDLRFQEFVAVPRSAHGRRLLQNPEKGAGKEGWICQVRPLAVVD